MNNLFSILLILLGLVAYNEAGGGGKGCVPPEKNFYYVPLCNGFANPKVHVKKITATQGNPPVNVDQNGGIDMTQPLILWFNLTTTLSKPIKRHRFDQAISQYIPDDNGNCHWDDVDTQGATDDIDACKLIKNVDCSYASKPTYVKSEINFSDLVGDLASGLEPGTYYAFEITERDGNEKINCFRLQAKVVKS